MQQQFLDQYEFDLGNKVSKTMCEEYDNIKSSLNTLDIVLFSGEGKFSCLIKCVTNSDYSHIGVIIKEEDLKSMGYNIVDSLKDPDGLYLFHSNKGIIKGIKDVTRNKTKSGAQINSLRKLLKKYHGSYFVRRLKHKAQIDHNVLSRSIEHLKLSEYETDYCEMLCATCSIFRCFFGYESLDELFCSELVAQVYMDVGLFCDDNVPSNKYTPKDFSEYYQSLPFHKGNGLGEEVEICIL